MNRAGGVIAAVPRQSSRLKKPKEDSKRDNSARGKSGELPTMHGLSA